MRAVSERRQHPSWTRSLIQHVKGESSGSKVSPHFMFQIVYIQMCFFLFFKGLLLHSGYFSLSEWSELAKNWLSIGRHQLFFYINVILFFLSFQLCEQMALAWLKAWIFKQKIAFTKSLLILVLQILAKIFAFLLQCENHISLLSGFAGLSVKQTLFNI